MTIHAFWLRSSLLSTVSLCLAACGGGSGASLRFSANDSMAQASRVQAQSVVALRDVAAPTFHSSDGVTFTLSEARIHLKDIRLSLPEGTHCSDVSGGLSGVTCGDASVAADDAPGGKLVIPGPLVVDLLGGTTTPDLSGLRLPAGTYQRIDFRLDEAKAGDVPADSALLGYSLQVKAGFEQDATPKTLELKLKFSEDARFESSTGVTVGENESLLALLSPGTWLEGLPVGQCLRKGDLTMSGDVVRIDDRAKGDCSGAENRVRDNIKNSGRLNKAQP